MSGPGQGYYQGQYAAQPGQAQSLFGQPAPGGEGGQQHDPFAQMGQQQHDPNDYYQQHDHGSMNTVYEEDEPASSPELGRHQWGQQQQAAGGQVYGAYGDQGGYDPYAQQQQGYDQNAYGQSAAQGGGAAAASSDPAAQQYDVPAYPGWIYNPVTNSYDADPNYQGDGGADGETGQQEQQGGSGADTMAQGGYGGYEQSQGQGYDAYAQGQAQHDPYAAQQSSDSFSSQPSADPYAQSANVDPYAAQQDPYGQQHSDPYAQQGGEQEDPYAADSNPYSNEGAQDPFGSAAQGGAADPYAPSTQNADPYGLSSQQAQQGGHFGGYEPAQPAQQAPPAQAQSSYDPYAPANARAASFSPPPASVSSRADAYSPPPQQQQYSSFAAFGQPEPAAAAPAQSAPYDPYAPVPKQQRARSGTASSSYDPYSPASSTKQLPPSSAPQQQGQPAPYDPYSPQGQQQRQQAQAPPSQAQQPYDPYAAQRQPQSQQAPPPTSPPVHHAPLPRVPAQGQPFGGMASPPPVTRAALSPPPRSSSAASSASARRAPTQVQEQPQAAPPPKAAGPPPRAGGAGAAPPRAAQPPPAAKGAAFDIPPPRQAAPLAQRTPQQRTQPLPAQAPAPEPVAAPPAAYAPAPAAPAQYDYSAPSQPVLPPSQRKGLMQPPQRRAPHQRGASAFGSDSPYGALPTGPPTSSYEPPQEIREEDEEEEEEKPKVGEEEQVEEKPEDVVPSWMQATAPPPSGPYYQPKPPVQEQQPPQPQGQDFADDFQQKLSLSESAPPLPPPHAAAPSRAGQAPPPPRQPQGGAPPPPRGAGAPPPPRGGPAPPPAAGGPPPPRSGPPPRGPPAQQRPPPPQQQQQGYQSQPPPSQPPRGRPPVHVPETPERGAVPQLHFEAPSPDTRPHPPPQQQQQYQQPRGEYSYGRSTPQPMSGIEETPEEEEAQEEQGGYFVGHDQSQQGENGAEEGTGATTPSSAYGGDWHADSENTQGYDYINQGHVSAPQPYDPYAPKQQQQQQQQPRDPYAPSSQQAPAPPAPRDPYAPSSQSTRPPAPPQHAQQDAYAPRDVPSRESTFTPPAQQRGPPGQNVYASPSARSRFGEPGAKPAGSPSVAMARANSYGAAPSTPSANDSYAPYPAQPGQGGQYSATADGNLTAPAAYGGFAPKQQQQQQQKQPHDPYAAQPKPALSRQASFTAGEVADLGLERCSAPVVSFGFGGRIALVFPSSASQGYSVDAANPYGQSASASSGSTVHIRKLADVVPPSASEEGSTAVWPGPIFLDGGKANAGKKRKEAVAWLGQRIGELEQEVKYAQQAAPVEVAGSAEEAKERRRKVEGKLVLYKLVLVMIENEGKLTGSPKVDDAVRAIFAPDSVPSAENADSLPTADQLAAAASAAKPPTGSEVPFVTYGVSPAHLDQMSSFLLRGERREAVRFALDNKMWAHAFIIASCVDTDCWKDVTVEFLRSELTPNAEIAEGGAEGREALRVAYSMFAGLGAESIQQFFPPRSLGPQASTLLPAAPIGNGPASAPLSRVPTETASQPLSEATLDKWQDTVGMIIANRTAGDSAALTALGDALAANGWTTAAHICYLLSPQTSLTSGLGTPGSRITLVGSTALQSDGSIDLESVKLTELVEFALSLIPTVKGQEPFVGFPHLQAYRIYHASALADQGQVPQALRYTEAVINTLKLATKPSPFYHPALLAQIKSLSERLGAAPGQKEASSWIAKKMPRPTVNSLWSTFEGGFNKFVAGDSEPSQQQLAAQAEVAKATNGAPVGPFSHYSSISPGSTSGTLSRTQSSSDLASTNHLQALVPPVRPLSATGPTSPLATNPPTTQAHPSPGPPPVKRPPYKGHHARSSSLGAFAGYEYNPNARPSWETTQRAAAEAKANEAAFTASPKQDLNLNGDASGAPRRHPQFAAVEESFQEDESGFISPMAHLTPSVSPASASNRPAQQQQPQTHRRMTTAEELADLGIGNSKSKKPAFDTLDEELEAEEGGITPTERTAPEAGPSSGATPPVAGAPAKAGAADDKPAIKPSKSWLGGWFKREASPNQGPGPVKANLGESKSFVYDEKLKRWVAPGAKGGDETPAAPTPPPRAATASPSRALRNAPPRLLSEEPPVPPMPMRSGTAPPPLSRSATSADLRSQASGPPSRPPSATGAFPPRSAGATPEGTTGRAGGKKRKPQYAHVAM